MAITASVRRPHDARPVLLFFVALTVAVIIGQTWWAIIQDKRLTLESEKNGALVAVRLLEEHATQTLQDAERKIDTVASVVRTTGPETGEFAIREIVAQGLQDARYLKALQYVNRQGQSWITSLDYPFHQADVNERQYIRFLLTHPDYRQVIIGHPFQSRYDSQLVVPVARNLQDRTGRHVGIISTDIRLSYLGGVYARVARNSDAMVALLANEGFIIARSPFEARYVDRDISDAPVLRQLSSGALEGWFEDDSFLDDEKPRLYTYRKIAGYPVTIVYGRDFDSILAAWQARTADRIYVAGGTIGFIGILTFFLLLHIKRLAKSETSLMASESRYRMLYESATDGILLINYEQVYVDCNPAAVKLLDVPCKADVVGRKVGDFSPATQLSGDPPLDKTRLINAAFAGEPQQFEWATLRHGKLHYNEVTLSRAIVDGTPLLLGIYRDISARKYVEALHEGQNLILHLIGTGADLQQILQEIVRFVELRAPHGRCVILLLSDDQTRVTRGVGPSLPLQLVAAMNGMRIAADSGCCSDAVLTRSPVMVADIETDPLMRKIRDEVTSTVFSSCGSWPIIGKQGQILGIFTILYRATGEPGSDDMQLVGISTDLAGIAIESRRAEERISHLAHYDELTGLPNRFLYTQHLNRALAHAERHTMLVGVLFLDLDRFKNINDTFGHEQGDAVLRNVALRFRGCLRDSDIIARIGGDEFIVLADDYEDPLELREIAQRLLIEAAKPFEIGGQECQLSASIGIATYPLDGFDAQALLKNADVAMYRAKSTGKDNYQFYSAGMNTHTIARMALEVNLRRAIERREFVMHYQPKVSLAGGRIAGAEALVRWRHPERGLLYPAEFITMAEEAGMIGPLGMLVLDLTCRDIVKFRESGISFGRVAINLSGSQFNDANLLDDVKSVVDLWHVDPSSLEFEITESMVMHNRDQAISLMDGIRALGFSLSIDDFGTGYSSLAYLKRFPVDSVKVDKSFINDIPHDANDSAIVQAIVVMAHTLGLKVTAEGVESLTQLEMLRKFACDEYQGFLFSEAVPAQRFVALLQSQ